jgi:hypothetical protein
MRSTIANYWWGGSGDGHRIHWLRWDSLTRHKIEGGDGLPGPASFQQIYVGEPGLETHYSAGQFVCQGVQGPVFS